MNSFWQFAASVIALVVLLLIVGLIEKRRTVVAVAPAPAPTPAPKTVKEALLPYALWLVILGVVAIVGIGYLVYAHASSVDWKLWIPIAIVLAGAINGLRYAGKGSVWLTIIVIVSCLAWLGMYGYYGDKAPEVAKDRQKEHFKDHTARKARLGNGGGTSSSARENADEKTEWVVTNLPVQLSVDDQGIYVPGKWSSPWQKPQGADHRCEYYSDVGVGRWYAIKIGENEKPLNLNSEKFVRLDDNFKTYYFKILLEGKKGFEVIQRCPA